MVLETYNNLCMTELEFLKFFASKMGKWTKNKVFEFIEFI